MTAASSDLEAAGPARQGCIDLLFCDIDFAQDAAGQVRRLDAERGDRTPVGRRSNIRPPNCVSNLSVGN